MINEQQLVDPSVCPSCSASPLSGGRCRECGVNLASVLGSRLWAVSHAAADALAERRQIIQRLRAEVRQAAVSIASDAAPDAAPRSSSPDVVPAATFPAQAGSGNPLSASPSLTRPEASPRSVQDVLLGLGALLLSVAAVVFLAVSWADMGIGGRSAILGGFTGLVAAGSAVAHRKGLSATAEAVGGLAIVLALIDAYGLRAAEVFGRDLPGPAYWAGATAVVALLSGLGTRILPLRALRLAAAVLAQASGWLLAVEAAARTADSVAPAAVLVPLFGALTAVRMLGRRLGGDVRAVVAVGQALAAVAALVLAAVGAYQAGAQVLAAIAVLGVLAVVAALAAALAVRSADVTAWSVVASLAVAAAVLRPVTEIADPSVAAATVVGIVAAALTVLVAVVQGLVVAGRTQPRQPAMAGVVAVGALAALGALLSLIDKIAGSLFGPIAWLTSAWRLDAAAATQPARHVLIPAVVGRAEAPDPAAAVLLVALAVAAVAGAAVLRRLGLGVAVAVSSLAIAVHVELVAYLPLAGALAGDLVLAVGWTAGAAFWRGRNAGDRAARTAQRTAVGTGLLLFVVATCWSFAVVWLTLLVIPVAVAACVAAAVVLARSADQTSTPTTSTWSPRETASAGAAAVAVVLVAVELLGAVAWLGGSWATAGVVVAVAAAGGVATSHGLPLALPRRRVAAVVPVTSGALLLLAGTLSLADEPRLTAVLAASTAGCIAGATARRGIVRPVWAGLAVASAVALAAVAALWAGLALAEAGLVAVVIAALLLVANPLVARAGDFLPASAADPMAGVAAGGMAFGLALAVLDLDVLWVALLVAGVATAAAAIRPDRHWVGWVSGALLVASTWVRLAISGVEAPEAYTAPGALALLVVGWFRRRGNAETSSWQAYGSGLVLLLIPSLARAVTDTGTTRPLLLGAVALAVLLVGGWRRLQAPLVIGGAVLALDALVQLAPTLAALYGTLPKWVSLGTVGLLLLVVGATYERRIAQLRRVTDGVTSMR